MCRLVALCCVISATVSLHKMESMKKTELASACSEQIVGTQNNTDPTTLTDINLLTNVSECSECSCQKVTPTTVQCLSTIHDWSLFIWMGGGGGARSRDATLTLVLLALGGGGEEAGGRTIRFVFYFLYCLSSPPLPPPPSLWFFFFFILYFVC